MQRSKQRERVARLQRASELVVVLAVFGSGLLVLSPPSETRRAVEQWINIDVLFAALLVAFVVLRFHCMTPRVLAQPAENYARYRQLKRIVYLLLYGIIAIRQLIGLVISCGEGKAVDFDLATFRPLSDSRCFGFDPASDSHVFFACGILALAVARILMFSISRADGTQEPYISVSSIAAAN